MERSQTYSLSDDDYYTAAEEASQDVLLISAEPEYILSAPAYPPFLTEEADISESPLLLIALTVKAVSTISANYQQQK